jgi:hypothetical protein
MVDDYFIDIVQLLCTGMSPSDITIAQKKKKLVVKDVDYLLIAGSLYKLGTNKILRRYVVEHERPIILVEVHDGIARGHYAGKATS